LELLEPGFAQFANEQYDGAARILRREETYRTVSRWILTAALALSGCVPETWEKNVRFWPIAPD
jgi:hypothetical protein